jgi:hypothetical protein
MILGRGPARAARGPGQGASPNDKNPPPRPGREALGRSRGGLSTKAASRSLAGVARSPALGAIIIGVISDLIEMLGIPALYEYIFAAAVLVIAGLQARGGQVVR